MIARREHHRAFIAAMAVTTFIAVILVGLIFYRSWVNDGRCEDALGQGAMYAGQDKCTPPPVRVNGLF